MNVLTLLNLKQHLNGKRTRLTSSFQRQELKPLVAKGLNRGQAAQ